MSSKSSSAASQARSVEVKTEGQLTKLIKTFNFTQAGIAAVLRRSPSSIQAQRQGSADRQRQTQLPNSIDALYSIVELLARYQVPDDDIRAWLGARNLLLGNLKPSQYLAAYDRAKTEKSRHSSFSAEMLYQQVEHAAHAYAKGLLPEDAALPPSEEGRALAQATKQQVLELLAE